MAWYTETKPPETKPPETKPRKSFSDLERTIQGYNVKLRSLGEQRRDLNAQLEDLREIRKSFLGPGATYIRWMIDNNIRVVEAKIARSIDESSEAWAKQELNIAASERLGAGAAQRAEIESRGWASALEPGQTRIGTYPVPGGKERQARVERARGVLAEPREGVYEAEPPPMPDWLWEYLETSMPLGGGAYAMRPLGAQAEIPSERLAHMGGYLGWAKAGTPTRFSEEALSRMARIPAWWEEYTRLSEKLFPKRVSLRARWYPEHQ